MPEPPGTLEKIAKGLAHLVDPLGDRLAAGEIRFLLAELGLQFPPSLETNAAFTNATKAAAQSVQQMRPLVAQLIAAIAANNVPQILARAIELGNAIRIVVEQIGNAANTLKAAGAGMGIPPAELNQFADELPGRLLEYLVVRRLEAVPGLAEAVEFTGGLERTEHPAVDSQHPAFTTRRLQIDDLTKFVQNPLEQLKNRYQWGAPGFNGTMLLQTVQRLLSKAGVPSVLDTSGPLPVLDALVFEITPKTDVNPPGLLITIADTIAIDNAAPFKQDDWELRFVQNAQLAVGAQLVLQPNDGVTFVPPSGQVQGDTYLEWTGGKSNGQPYLIFGQAGGSRVEAQQLVARAGVGFAWNSGANRGEGFWKIAGEVKQGKIIVDLTGADGFLGKILAGVGLESEFNVGLGFSTRDGLVFHGSAALEIQLPIHVSLGPVDISALTLTIGIHDSKFPIGVAADIKAMLGPLQAVVEQIGVRAELSLPPGHNGNLGPVNFDLGFKPPNGVGLSVDAGVVKGGGYLYFDFDREEYAGVLELSISEIVTVKAIGLITTKMPDGSKGFSLLIIITAEFGTGIQLGFGFTLIGLGGLLGLNRTMNLQPLMEGVRTGAINSIMFPQNPVANAPKIISDLRTIFPPYEGKFLIGPMAKLGWGTPTLVSVSLGVIIEIPGNIAILGVLKIALPAEDAALIVLQVNFAGAIEFDKSRLYFFAALFESRVLFLTLEGEMGLLVAWGDDANFVVSAGGFHPRFNPPPLPFPSPRRIAISILNTDIARIRTETYFAVTSNTVQFGSSTEIMFDVGVARVDGHMAFDALFQFSPFYFIIEISASVSLKVFGVGLFSISLQFALEGPTPWRAHGTGTLSLFFFDVSADFDITWGDSKDTTLPPIAVIAVLKSEFEKLDNWRAQLPANNNLLVSLRKLDDTESAQVLHPLGTLRVSQRAVPLDLKIDKVGNQKPSDANQFKLTATAGLVKANDADEQFAKAQFLKMSDADKLSQRAFDPMHSGLLLASGAQQLGSSKMGKRKVRYEEIIIDSNYKRFRRRFRVFTEAFFSHFLVGGAVSKSVLSQNYRKLLDPFEEKVAVKEGGFTVAHTENNKPYSVASTYFANEAMAHQFVQTQVAANPDLHDALHVIPQYEARL